MRTARTSSLPPFATQPIGSLPRPAGLHELLSNGPGAPSDERRRALDEHVLAAIRLQEQAGLDVVSDGEWRRTHYVREFLARIGGFERCRTYRHQGVTRTTDVCVRRMQPREPVFAEEARFLARNTSRLSKFALPSPFLIAVRYWHADHSAAAYPSARHFMDHLAEILRREAEALVEAGIDVVQLDDPALTYYCDPDLTSGAGSHDERLAGAPHAWNAERELPEAIEVINRVAEGLRAEVHLHCCHSVSQRRSDVRGSYRPLLPFLAAARVDRVNLEFAYAGTGEASDLALLPAHLALGMGVVDVRTAAPQSVEEIEALATAGAAHVEPARIALNPDCGFAPDAGEPPTLEEATLKLERLCQAALRLRARTSTRSPTMSPRPSERPR
jgi:5-methyltetrahydropteroyltriglutamate--homocysteine methyltransferase